MTRLLPALAASLVFAGCATTEKKAVPDSAVAVVLADENQTLLARSRAEVIVSRLGQEELAALSKAGRFVVRTLGPTPQQLTAARPVVTDPTFGLMLWNVKAARLDDANLYLATALPPPGQPVRLGEKSAMFLGSQ